LFIALGGLMALSAASAQQTYFSDWPAGTSPQEVGKLVAEHFVTSPHQGKKHIIYPEVCAWYGGLTFAQLAGDKELSAKLVHKFDPLLTPEEANMIPHGHHVDNAVFGALPFEIYIETKDAKYLELGVEKSDEQWAKPGPDGLSDESRFWIDDMYMITILQVQAYRATGDAKYVDRAALEMTTYLARLQQPNGLFYHAPTAPFYWLRGNGWVAAGMTELLSVLPENHPKRGTILDAYRKMMAAVLQYQSPDGTWRQIIDHPEAWPESSGTGMFAFALVTGVKKGWLDEKTYGPAARKGWIALAGYVDQHADITQVCEGTNAKTNIEYYLARKRQTGDFHGQAPLLWTASALLR
jgi:rhamnogalacturonyl hydrolase YesR